MSRGRLPAGARGANDGDDGWALTRMPGGLLRVAALFCALACSADARLGDGDARAVGPGVRAPHAIDFATASAGLEDVAGRPTGFSLTLPSTRAATYLAARVRVDAAAHELVLAPGPGTAGDAANAIGLPVVLPSGRARVETTLVDPVPGAGAGERAGVWFGSSDDNYIELGLASSPEGPVLRALMEEDGTPRAPITRRVQLPADGVRLALELQPTERIVRAYGTVGAAASEQLLATFEAVPDAWFERDRAGLMDGDASPRGLVGVFASAGSRPPELPPLAHRFRGFEVSIAGSTTDLPTTFGRWQRGTASVLPAGLSNAVAAALGGKIFVLGDGAQTERTPLLYDPDTDRWQRGPRLPEGFPQVASPAVVAHRGALVVIGGLIAGSANASSNVVALDPTTGTWSALAALPVPLGAAVAASIDGNLYVAGGLDGTVSHAELWVMRAGSGIWSPAASMSSARHGAASAVIGGRLYVFGGTREGGAALALAEVYDPGTNEWSALAPLPAPLSFASATAGHGRAVVLAGEMGSATGSPAWLYHPVADAWSALPPAPRSRSRAATAWVGNSAYVLGGAALDGAVDVLKLD